MAVGSMVKFVVFAGVANAHIRFGMLRFSPLRNAQK
jgi:hypothetical protein